MGFWIKTKLKQMFCIHTWREGHINPGYEPSPFKIGLIWGEGYYKVWHCIKCDKHISSTIIPISFEEK